MSVMLIIDDYDLPDKALMKASDDYGKYLVWKPDKKLIIIGKGSNPQEELNIEEIYSNNISIIRRNTGGCSVYLSSNMYVVSFALYKEKNTLKNPMKYFKLFNSLIIKALTQLGIKDIVMMGISDLSINNKKFSGSSIYRNNKTVFFHNVINYCENTYLLERYLKHPPREPDYRRNRSHKDFVTSLKNLGYNISLEELEREIKAEWNKLVISLKKQSKSIV